MKKFTLSPEKIDELHAAHKSALRYSNTKAVYKINAVILLGSGWTLDEVSEALLLNDETLRKYSLAYKAGGLAQLLETHHKGSSPKLSANQELQLCQELNGEIYMCTEAICAYVKAEFGIDYSISGMRDLLHRLNYVYKKPKLVPGNPDINAQDEFEKQYEDFMINRAANTEVLFMDAVHPEHNAMASYGWIKRGETRRLKTNSGRQRLNLHGVINAETHEVTVIESETVNEDSTIDLLDAVYQKYAMSLMIYIILDNARYHYSRKVQAYLKGKNIKLVFLPSYSPNLNLIERLWKFFKKKVLYNTYYENIDTFRQACMKFFRNIDQHSGAIANFMDAEFDIA